MALVDTGNRLYEALNLYAESNFSFHQRLYSGRIGPDGSLRWDICDSVTREVVSLPAAQGQGQGDGLPLTMPWRDDADEVAVCLDASVLTCINLDPS